MLKVLLIRPPGSEYFPRAIVPPYALACIAAYIEDIAEVKIFDAEGKSVEAALREVTSFQPQIVGLTTFTTAAVASAQLLAIAIRQQDPHILVVMGGHGATFLAEELLRTNCVDVVVRGEGEWTMRELVETGSPEKIAGLSFAQNGSIVHNPPRPVMENLDDMRLPAYHLLDLTRTVAYLFETSRGCPHHCNYCEVNSFWGSGVRTKSPRRVLEELKYLVDYLGAVSAVSADDNLAVNIESFGQACELMLKQTVKVDYLYFGACPDDRLAGSDPELIEAMSRLGVKGVTLEIASGSPKILEEMQRSTNPQQVRQIVDLLHTHNLGVKSNFILGYPCETPQTIQESVNLAIELDPDGCAFHLVAPCPGSEIYTRWKQEGLFLTTDWARYTGKQQSVKTSYLPDHALEDWHDIALRRFYYRADWMASRFKQVSSAAIAKGSWSGYYRPARNFSEWCELMRGYAGAANEPLATVLPNYSADIQFHTDIGAMYLRVRGGRLTEFAEGEIDSDVTVETDNRVLNRVIGEMKLDILGAFILRQMRFDGTLHELMGLVRWVNAFQEILDIQVMDVPFQHPTWLTQFSADLQSLGGFEKLAGQRKKIVLKTSAGEFMLKWQDEQLADLQLLDKAARERRKKFDWEISLSDPVAQSLFSCDLSQWATILQEVATSAEVSTV